MKITYSELFELLWMAKIAYKEDYKNYQMQSDAKAIQRINKLLQYISQTNSLEFIIDEMPF